VALVAAAASLPYLWTLDAPFALDDGPCIVHNPALRPPHPAAPGPPPSSCAPPSRAFGEATLALNFRLGGLEPRGYHLFNLAVHLGAALLVLALVTLALRSPRLAPADGPGPAHPDAPLVALFAALLFAAHPIQTQAITYVVQRFASLAALLYLLSATLYLAFRLARPGPGRWLAYLGALAACLLAMYTKETSFTLPLALVLLEVGLFRGAAWGRLLGLLPFLLTLALIPITLLGASGALAGVGQVDEALRGMATNATMTRWEYLLTEVRVAVTYLRLLLWPAGQNLDPDVPLRRSLLDPAVLGSLALLGTLAALGALALGRWARRATPSAPLVGLAGLGVLWFFLNLVVEGSFVPLPDVQVEHRLYLPSVGFLAAISALAFLARARLAAARPGLARLVVPGLAAAVAALGLATLARNALWRDGLAIWEDAAAKSPGKARVHLELGRLYLEARRLDEAARELGTASRLDPADAAPHNTLGAVRKRQGRPEEALASYQEALRLKPGWAEVHHNIGLLLAAEGRLPEAMAAFQEAIRLKPGADSHNALGVAYAQQGRLDEAAAQFRAALALDPAHAGARRNLAKAGAAR
jgi:Flp pilus assembly protein TadD